MDFSHAAYAVAKLYSDIVNLDRSASSRDRLKKYYAEYLDKITVTGDDMKNLRENMDLNRDEFAVLAGGVSRITVRNWEVRGSRPVPAQAVMVYHFLDAATR